jgi:hypothetical protein
MSTDVKQICFSVLSTARIERAPVPVPLEDAICNMEVIDAIVASGCSGSWVRPRTAYIEPDLEREHRTKIQNSRDDFAASCQVKVT